MNSILELLASQNSLLSSGLIGAVFGVIGTLFAKLIINLKPQLGRNRNLVFPIIVTLFSISGIALIKPAIEDFKREEKINEQVKKLTSELKVFEVIFAAYPEEEKNFRELISNPKRQSESEESKKEFYKNLVTKYFLPNLVQAPDDLVNQYIINSGRILYATQTTPNVCIEYFNGIISSNTLALLPKDLMQKELEIKGFIIEAGIANEAQVSLENLQTAMSNIYTKYQEYGYDSGEIKILFSGKFKSPQNGCDMAMRFTYTLASMKDSGSEALKTLVHLQLNPPSK
jgi:hypothetical protein